jgi:hypothetical protein
MTTRIGLATSSATVHTIDVDEVKDDGVIIESAWSFHTVVSFCVPDIVVNTGEEQTRSFLLA